jgi:glucose-1-phosphate cytidylyltransferase
MKVVILAGGMGSRLSEETGLRPKPMVEIGGRPILWHIMNIYAACGFTEFIIALGYKSEVIKDYFLNFYALNNDISIDLKTGKTVVHDGNQPNWKIHLVDTGLHTETGGRLKRLARWFDSNETFMFTYGDGVADIDLNALLTFHNSSGKLATVTAVRTPARFGRMAIRNSAVTDFYEKPEEGEGWINGGFFVLNSQVLNYIDGDKTSWEHEPIERLAREGQMAGFTHRGFWSCMDTLREKNMLDDLWNGGRAPWRTWDRSERKPNNVATSYDYVVIS